jgi:AcrR family transcriptional regulator
MVTRSLDHGEAPGNRTGAGLASQDKRIDGRRERSAESRRRILAAGIRLVESGVPTPTAEQIAQEAAVSLRTVFRHFEEMDRLSLEIVNGFLDEILPLMDGAAPSGEGPAALDAVIERRLKVVERMLAFSPAIDVHRHRSQRIAARHREVAAAWSRQLAEALPEPVRQQPGRLAALDLLLSLEGWQRLRTVQGLSADEAAAAVRGAAQALAGTRAFGN